MRSMGRLALGKSFQAWKDLPSARLCSRGTLWSGVPAFRDFMANPVPEGLVGVASAERAW